MSDDDIQAVLLAAGHEPETFISADTLRTYSRLLLDHPRADDEVARVASEELSVLTQKQKDCLLLAAKGLSSAEIGAALCISPRTVEFRMSQVQDSLQMTTTEAVVLACKAGWL